MGRCLTNFGGMSQRGGGGGMRAPSIILKASLEVLHEEALDNRALLPLYLRARVGSVHARVGSVRAGGCSVQARVGSFHDRGGSVQACVGLVQAPVCSV